MHPANPDPPERASSEPQSMGETGAPSANMVRTHGPTALILAAGVIWLALAAWLGGEMCLDLIKPPRHHLNSRHHPERYLPPRAGRLGRQERRTGILAAGGHAWGMPRRGWRPRSTIRPCDLRRRSSAVSARS